MSTPFMMLISTIQIHFEHPGITFLLTNIFNDSLLYMMLIINLAIYITITSYICSREYTENTLKNVLPIPISRTKLLLGKFCTLFIWMMILTFLTWLGILAQAGLYHVIFGFEGFTLHVAMEWLLKFLSGGILMFLTVSPFAYIAQKTKGFVTPIITSAVILLGSVALSNQDLGALYPWTGTLFLITNRIQDTGYPIYLSITIIALVSIAGFWMTFYHFNKEDIK